MKNRIYIAIDLKSFYASVECKKRDLDPLTTNLVVADIEKTEKTICLAVSPSLKSFGVPGRPRLFEAIQKVKEANRKRQHQINYYKFTGKSTDYNELMANPELEIDFIIAPPHMADYMKYSNRIYEVYLKYIAPEDIHVYSVDEVFIDVTAYLNTYKMTAHELAMTMIRDVLNTTGITATAGIGTNLYLCKVAMDIVAKKMPADKDGVRIAELNEQSYRERLWNHQPLTDFWRVGAGISRKLEALGLHTMGDVARFSLNHESYLYKLFGINAELLIDHAWGVETTTMDCIKKIKPQRKSMSSGQVLAEPYNYEKTKLIVKEMTDLLVLDMIEKGFMSSQFVMTLCYDVKCLTDESIRSQYHGPIAKDWYGKPVPKDAHGTINLEGYTDSIAIILKTVETLYERIMDKNLLVRKIFVVASKLMPASQIKKKDPYEQIDLFTDVEELERKRKQEEIFLDKEKRLQLAILDIKNKYGKNAILKGMNLEEGATAKARNEQIGGHKA